MPWCFMTDTTISYLNTTYEGSRIQYSLAIHIVFVNEQALWASEENRRMMIQTTGLTKLYTTTEVVTTALKQVNFEVRSGEFVAVMGPSGGGKSTLLHLLGLLDTPSEGTYVLLDQDVSQCSERQRVTLRKSTSVSCFRVST